MTVTIYLFAAFGNPGFVEANFFKADSDNVIIITDELYGRVW